jgi:hypothetical protein
MFEVSVSHWALNFANGICGSSQQELSCLEISEKNDWEEFPVKQMLYTHADLILSSVYQQHVPPSLKMSNNTLLLGT